MITDEQVLETIHLNYRTLYFKDIVAARWLDESTLFAIMNLISNNYQVILDHIFSDVNTPEQIINAMKPEASLDIKLQTAKFLYEVCNASKLVIGEQKSNFFCALLQKGFLPCIRKLYEIPQIISETKTLPSNNETEKYSLNDMSSNSKSDSGESTTCENGANKIELLQGLASEILVRLLQIVPINFIATLTNGDEKEKSKLMLLLLDILLISKLDGPRHELAEFFKCLLNPETEYLKMDILNIFYDDCIPLLVNWLKSNNKDVSSLYLILDLLIFCVKVHAYKAKYFVIQYNILNWMESMYQISQTHIKLSIVKLLKSIIELNDDEIYNHMVSNNSLKPVIDLMEKLKSESLIKCAMFDLFSYIGRKDVTILVKYLVETFPEFIKSKDPSKLLVTKELRISYEKCRVYSDQDKAKAE